MSPALRIGAAIVAVGLAVYAGILIVGGDGVSESAVEGRKVDRKARDAAPSKASRTTRPPVAAPTRTSPGGTAAEPTAGTPAEAISPADARVELTKLVDDLESMVERGETVSQERFVELYKRGSELAQTLAGANAGADPAEQKEFADLHTRFRVAIMKVQSRGGG